jgi:hypothetical protein
MKQITRTLTYTALLTYLFAAPALAQEVRVLRSVDFSEA